MKFTILLVILAICSSCSTYFHMGNATSQVRKHNIPVYNAEEKNGSLIVGASYSGLLNKLDNYNHDKFSRIESFDGNVYYVHNGKNDYYSFGLFGYGGSINATKIESRFLKESVNAGRFNFYGMGLDFEYGLNISHENIESRPIGFRFSIQNEAGSYVNYKDKIVESSDYKENGFLEKQTYFIKCSPNNIGYSALLTHEIVFKKFFIPTSIDLTYGLGIGMMVGSVGISFNKGPLTVFARSTHNVDAHFYTVGLNLNIVRSNFRNILPDYY